MLLFNMVQVHRVTLDNNNSSDRARDYISNREASLFRAKCLQITRQYTDTAVLSRRPHVMAVYNNIRKENAAAGNAGIRNMCCLDCHTL